VDATVACIRDVGYRNCTIERVAATAGVGKQTIYRWWRSKGELVLDSVQGAFLQNVTSTQWTADVRADLRDRLHATVRTLNDERFGPACAGVVWALGEDPVLAARWTEQFFTPTRARHVERISRGQWEGQIRRDVDPHLVADLLWGPIWCRHLVTREPVDPAFADVVVDTAFTGLRPARRTTASQKAVLDAALSSCAEAGFLDSTVQGIAERAGVTKQTVYRHWPSKAAIVLDAVETEVIGRGLYPGWSVDPLADVRDRLVGLADALTDARLGPAIAGLLSDTYDDPELLPATRDRIVGATVEPVRKRLDRAAGAGLVRDDVPAAAAGDLLYGPIWFRFLMSGAAITPTVVDELLDAAFDGVVAKGATPGVDSSSRRAPAGEARTSRDV
jgi:AcrR family transcriptional regulator